MPDVSQVFPEMPPELRRFFPNAFWFWWQAFKSWLYNTKVTLVVKTDTGTPPSPFNGMLEINTADNVVRIYADGDWRTLASW